MAQNVSHGGPILPTFANRRPGCGRVSEIPALWPFGDADGLIAA